MAAEHESENERLVRRAINLFTFLGRTQQLLVKPVRTVDKFEDAMWFAGLPDHEAIRSAHRIAELTPDEPLLTVDRVAKLDPPPLPHELVVWVEGAIDDAEKGPSLREAIFRDEPVPVEEREDGAPEVVKRRVELAEHPEISEAFEGWLIDWRLWADRERRDAAVRDIYKDLFTVHLKAADHSEEFELVVGVGCLAWRPENHEQVQRHVATAPIAISFDENSGRLTVTQVSAPDAVSIEVDMLDPALISSPAKLDEIKALAADYDGHLLDQPAIGEICRRLIHRLDADAEYDEDAVEAPTGPSPRGAFAPAIILRRRTNRGMVQIYEQIVAQIQLTGEVPKGVLPLVDPNRQPESAPRSDVPGAVVTVDGEDFLPLPVNDKQRQIIERVDSRAQTVVQGPPGTGKTHTAAALVSHLLAQGKRVLITAQTDRALKEVRAKLPREIQSLAVAVIGQSRSDMADLRTAVDNISRRADDFDPAESQRSIARHVGRIDDLRRQRAALRDRLLTVRRQEVEPRTDGPAQGTLAAIAYDHLQHETDYEWIRAFEVDPTGAGTTVSTEEIQRWRAVLRDEDVTANEAEATSALPDTASLTTPEDFANLAAAEAQAAVRKDQFGELLSHESFSFVRSLTAELRDELRARVSNLAEQAGNLERRQEAWMNDALHDVRSGRQQAWVARSAQVKSLAEAAGALTRRIGPTTAVLVSGGDFGVHQQVAKSLLAHIESGSAIKTRPDGSPKVGAFTSKTVKLAEPFFAAVKINDLPATTKEQLVTFIDWVDASRTVSALDQAWPVNVLIPDEDTLDEKVQWHVTEVAQLDKVLALGDQLEVERQWFQTNNLPVPDWNKLEDIRRYADLVEAAAAADDAVAAATPVERLHGYVRTQAQLPTPPAITVELLTAVRDRDVDGYAAAHARLHRLYDVARAIADRDRIRRELDQSAPVLAREIAANPAAAEWDSWLDTYGQAWRWEMTGRWILAQDSEDANVLKVSLNAVEDQIRTEVEHLAAERAWGHAVAPDRLTGAARANLTQYAQLVSRLGKGTGKYAAKQRVAIAEAMDRCRPSVPVWIMPLYRIAEQVHVEPNLYDVVIVDEASQAGLEASFLQYLAPKMVVIGDDKQVSPSAVGVDQQQLRDLANMYLSDDPYRESWLDPKRSYFDEANMRFGGRITLTEHRRCVPEIIGFSNHIAYEPEGIRLVPVRQFGAERLDPIKVVYLPDGYEAPNKTNLVEAEAIVDQIRKCLAEPQYDGATFGVISLLGKEQAKLIEGKLLDAVPPEEWAARELRCGDASDFQGSERDVMFLSMVKAPEEGKRMGVLTQQQYVQRFNVAASRAKDQMWVYHSMPRESVTNSECMRFQLLDYCYGTANRLHNDGDTLCKAVPEDVRTPPFDSLFEQRVFNRLIDRGYTVMPQVESMGYRIDMVVTGAKGRLAIECDGDFWHGPEQYENDLARQRELERCGWEFHRIRESVFYADMPGTLQGLWDTLDELDIRTADWIDPSFSSDEEVNVEDPDVDLIVDEDGHGESGLSVHTESESTLGAAKSDGAERGTNEDAGSVSPVDLLGQLVDSSLGITGGRHRVAEAENTDRDCSAVDDEASVVAVGTERITAVGGTGLLAYAAFSDQLPPIHGTQLNALVGNVVRIVEVEGPVLGGRIHDAYRIAYGGQRIGRELARTLNQAIELAVRRGLILSDNPLNEPGVKPRTFRLPSQSEVVVRELGPRTLGLVPPSELASHLAEYAGVTALSEDELYKAVLDVLGLKRLTDVARSVLSDALKLVPDVGSIEIGGHV
ncbi:AAA domain-containing protein [Mycolicibacterium fortuitum]|uniref:AAA domain-containing protein n=1 Tax=Mycolicibacterium fortuitum TaxID=1766 RepID=UPI0007ECE1B7|nr:AAA domain-containing protein [Mycolicibacterium fortuitum]OBK05235.1 ATP-binding protein IstB [Mycolicibacterium fortuitum]